MFEAMEIQVGSTVMNVGSTVMNELAVLRITERVEEDPRWKTSGWRGQYIPLSTRLFIVAHTGFIPDFLVHRWQHVPFEWRPVAGGATEERYVWTADYRHLEREVRLQPERGSSA